MTTGNPLMGTATAILVHMLDGRPGDAALLAESVEPDDRLTLAEAFAKAWVWTTTGLLRASGQSEEQARSAALRMARGLTLDLASGRPDEADGTQ